MNPNNTNTHCPQPAVTSDFLQRVAVCRNERDEAYGGPGADFSCTARLWTAYLNRRYPEFDITISAADVPMMQMLLKISRQALSLCRGDIVTDSLTDIAGYADCLASMSIEIHHFSPDGNIGPEANMSPLQNSIHATLPEVKRQRSDAMYHKIQTETQLNPDSRHR